MFKKGKSGNPNGRPVGSKGEFNKTVKETVLAVFNKLQENPVVNLEAWAIEEPTEFYKIAAKLIPTEVSAQVDGNLNVFNVGFKKVDEDE